jgi:hypothetical protein
MSKMPKRGVKRDETSLGVEKLMDDVLESFP